MKDCQQIYQELFFEQMIYLSSQYQDLSLDKKNRISNIYAVKNTSSVWSKEILENKEPEELPLHPLLDKDKNGNNLNDHYYRLKETAIYTIEKENSVEEVMSWAKITIQKYKLRMGFKDDEEKELKKIEAYKRYYDELNSIIEYEHKLKDIQVLKAFKIMNKKWRYR